MGKKSKKSPKQQLRNIDEDYDADMKRSNHGGEARRSQSKKSSNNDNVSLYHIFGTLSSVVLVAIISVLYKGYEASNLKAFGSLDYKVISEIPHDPKAFTQGLTYAGGYLYESTGMEGQSQVRRLDPKTGDVLASVDIPAEMFGEGITVFGEKRDKLIQLTWKHQVGFVYNITTLEVIKQFKFDTATKQGWGITYNPDQRELIVSDGSDWLYFWDEDTLKETRRVRVWNPRKKSQRLALLNELEFIDGKLFANLWYRDFIVSFDPANGALLNMYEFEQLWPKDERPEDADCFNGISLSDVRGEYFMTGKLWPTIYRLKLKPKKPGHL
mmetsp:Transcript_25819/g.40036  ORF Transcript_25819/g.40036 Transcript_25819/m.40036 type:complete len:327 (-) Transcript_25819:76-1056(-)|eukprot:CAMPEP_0196817048 /NCGR_PEP_ID=MMETSP1362-20130617/58535_1 /TAXON_ID=163516 /ORGANISM="Leptocylindrus danicus, Strain CCMP1856" /LENGTH=326 /DNA_ID=CAMNT_0042194595 /DNA_START=233 /DNA_END=1213 /DNA_ORIENTATION=-